MKQTPAAIVASWVQDIDSLFTASIGETEILAGDVGGFLDCAVDVIDPWQGH